MPARSTVQDCLLFPAAKVKLAVPQPSYLYKRLNKIIVEAGIGNRANTGRRSRDDGEN